MPLAWMSPWLPNSEPHLARFLQVAVYRSMMSKSLECGSAQQAIGGYIMHRDRKMTSFHVIYDGTASSNPNGCNG